MKKVSIEIYNTYFIVRTKDIFIKKLLETITSSLITYTYNYDKITKRTYRVPDRGFYTYDKFRDIYRFTINIFKDFIYFLGNNSLNKNDIEISIYKDYEIEPLDVTLSKNYEARDYQISYKNEIVKPGRKHILIDLQAGLGKSFIASMSIVEMNMKTCLLVLPKYIDKWIIDLKRYMDVDDDNIYVVQGIDSLINLLENDHSNYKFIIFSMRTMYNVIKDYEELDITYHIPPDKIIQELKVGVLLNDETHQEFYALFKMSLYCNVKKLIGLSATLDSHHKDIKDMYFKLFPEANRASGIIPIKKIANCYAVCYSFSTTKGIQYKRPQGYDHNLFEKSIIRRSFLLKEYLNMINHYVEIGYIKRRKPGQKLLIFAASIAMCNYITNYLKGKYSYLNIGRYVGEDDYSVLMESDISVSTQGSAGVAVDIAGLITVIQTVSMSSLQANQQNIGRLREIPDVECRYYYLYSVNIPSQVKMHKDRLDQIKKVIKEINFERYDKILRL